MSDRYLSETGKAKYDEALRGGARFLFAWDGYWYFTQGTGNRFRIDADGNSQSVSEDVQNAALASLMRARTRTR